MSKPSEDSSFVGQALALDKPGPPEGPKDINDLKIAIVGLEIVADVALEPEDLLTEETKKAKFHQRFKEVLDLLQFNLPMTEVVYNSQKNYFTLVGFDRNVEGTLPS